MDHEACVQCLMECGQAAILYLPTQELTKIFITILTILSKLQKIMGYIGTNFIREHLRSSQHLKVVVDEVVGEVLRKTTVQMEMIAATAMIIHVRKTILMMITKML